MEKEEVPNSENEVRARQKNVQNPIRFETISEQVGIGMAIESIPAEGGGESVTGDFYRTHRLNDGRLSVFIGDIEGHGQKAAEVTLALHNFMDTPAFQRSYTKKAQASDILKYIDQNIPPSELSITLAHVLLNPETKQLQYANAGMPALYVLTRSGEISEIRSSGLYMGLGYSSHNSGTALTELSPGDTVILISDGVIEAASKKGGKMKERFKELVREGGGTVIQPRELAQHVISELASPRKDDATILIFQLPNQ